MSCTDIYQVKCKYLYNGLSWSQSSVRPGCKKAVWT